MVYGQAVPDEFAMGALDSSRFEATPQEPRKYATQPLGIVRLQQITPAKGGPAWTVLSMWDRSGDSRGNSNSSFLTVGVFTAEEMWALAERDFPTIVKRIREFKEG